jgi:Transposase IS200 like
LGNSLEFLSVRSPEFAEGGWGDGEAQAVLSGGSAAGRDPARQRPAGDCLPGDDHACYRRLLAEAARHHGCAVHAYVLMTNHVHLLLTPGTADGPSRMMQWLCVRYVRHINTT